MRLRKRVSFSHPYIHTKEQKKMSEKIKKNFGEQLLSEIWSDIYCAINVLVNSVTAVSSAPSKLVK